MSTANDVKAALNEVLAEDETKTESQPVKQQSPEVTQALKAVLGKEEADASEDDAGDEEKGAEDKSKGKNQTVPLDRLSKVVKQKNEALEQLKALEEKFKAATERESKLTAQVGALETDAQILAAIKGLAQDEKYRAHVVAIDKALQGIDDEIEKATEKGDNKAVSAAEKRFEQKTAELEALLNNQRQDALWNEAAAIARQVLADLPEDYTDEDRRVIGKLWTSRVDWDGIEAVGSDAIPAALNVSLAEVIKEYGTPRGALVSKTTKDIESRTPEAKVVSTEAFVKETLGKNWGEVKDGKPVLSDDEFAKAAAQMMRKTRGA